MQLHHALPRNPFNPNVGSEPFTRHNKAVPLKKPQTCDQSQTLFYFSYLHTENFALKKLENQKICTYNTAI